jgi:hypothetical protein
VLVVGDGLEVTQLQEIHHRPLMPIEHEYMTNLVLDGMSEPLLA